MLHLSFIVTVFRKEREGEIPELHLSMSKSVSAVCVIWLSSAYCIAFFYAKKHFGPSASSTGGRKARSTCYSSLVCYGLFMLMSYSETLSQPPEGRAFAEAYTNSTPYRYQLPVSAPWAGWQAIFCEEIPKCYESQSIDSPLHEQSSKALQNTTDPAHFLQCFLINHAKAFSSQPDTGI